MTPLDPLPPPFLDAAALVGVRPTIGVAPGLSGPATFGLRRPLVLIPPAVLALEPALQQSLVCHELLHVRRRDWIWSVAEEVVCAAGWFHPAIWWLTAQIDLAREQLVDAEVVRLTGGRKPSWRHCSTWPVPTAAPISSQRPLSSVVVISSSFCACSRRRFPCHARESPCFSLS